MSSITGNNVKPVDPLEMNSRQLLEYMCDGYVAAMPFRTYAQAHPEEFVRVERPSKEESIFEQQALKGEVIDLPVATPAQEPSKNSKTKPPVQESSENDKAKQAQRNRQVQDVINKIKNNRAPKKDAETPTQFGISVEVLDSLEKNMPNLEREGIAKLIATGECTVEELAATNKMIDDIVAMALSKIDINSDKFMSSLDELMSDPAIEEMGFGKFNLKDILKKLNGSNIPEAVSNILLMVDIAIPYLKHIDHDELFDAFDKIVDSVNKIKPGIDKARKIFGIRKDMKSLGTLVDIFCKHFEKFAPAVKSRNVDASVKSIEDLIEDYRSNIEVITNFISMIGQKTEPKEEAAQVKEEIIDAVFVEDKSKTNVKKPQPKDNKKGKEVVQQPVPEEAAFGQNHIPEEDDGTPAICKTSHIVADEKVVPSWVKEVKAEPKPKPQYFNPIVQQMDENTKSFVNNPKFAWIGELVQIANKYELALSVMPCYDQAGNLKLISIAARKNGVIVPDKSFAIDTGEIINGNWTMWNNCYPNGMFHPVERCDYAFYVFRRDSGNRELNRDFFELLFKVGFNGLNEKNRAENSAYGKSLIEANRVIAMISMPHFNKGQKEEMKQIKNAMIRMSRFISQYLQENGISPQRFCLYDFDYKTLSFKVTNEGVSTGFLAEPQHGPIIEFVAIPKTTEDGEVVTEKYNDHDYIVYNCTPIVTGRFQ